MPRVRSLHGVPTARSPYKRRSPGPGRALRRLAAVAVGLVPFWVVACPTCVEKAPESMLRSALLVGAMLLLPFLLVALGAWAAIRTARGDAKRSS